jgi:hypothetical protein
MSAQSLVPSIPAGVPKSKAPDPVYARLREVLGTFSFGSSPPFDRDPTTRPARPPPSDAERYRIRLTILSIATVVAVATALYVGGFL